MDGIRYSVYALWSFEESMAALVLYIVKALWQLQSSAFYILISFIKKKIATGEKLKIQYNKKQLEYQVS